MTPPPRSIYSIPFSFHIAAPSPPTGPFCLRRNLNRINQTNFDKMSFTMKSKSLYLPLFLSICLSLSLYLSFCLRYPSPTTQPGRTGLVWLGPIRPFLLLCCAPPALPPLPHSRMPPAMHGGSIPFLLSTTTTTKQNTIVSGHGFWES